MDVFVGSGGMAVPDVKSWGALRALDPLTGEKRWEFRYHAAPWGGTLATAGGLVFAGDMDGYVISDVELLEADKIAGYGE